MKISPSSSSSTSLPTVTLELLSLNSGNGALWKIRCGFQGGGGRYGYKDRQNTEWGKRNTELSLWGKIAAMRMLCRTESSPLRCSFGYGLWRDEGCWVLFIGHQHRPCPLLSSLHYERACYRWHFPGYLVSKFQSSFLQCEACVWIWGNGTKGGAIDL